MADLKKDAIHADRASKGGVARMKKMSREERSKMASAAAKKRWSKPKNQQLPSEAGIAISREESPELPELPEARYSGILTIAGTEIPAYVLSNGQRVITRISATEMLTGVKRQGDLESYIRVEALKPFLDVESVLTRMVSFRHKDVEMVNEHVKGLPSDLFIEICQGYVAALNANLDQNSPFKLSQRQAEIAIKASIFLAACAKVGLDALIDEATGYQYQRPSDELELKLKLYLADEMRKWEKTFPDDLWQQFGRLTHWKGKLNQRPKYWGKLVMELIYEYLDPEVAQWLRENAPKPRGNQSYHRWLTEQYGLRKLVEHIWKVIGIAATCSTIEELRYKMQELYGAAPGFQFQLRLTGPKAAG